MVLVRSHAERIVVLFNDEVVADHPRQFRRDKIIYDPWHYLPVLVRKPGALRNGAPFKDLGGCEFQRILNWLYYSHIWTFWPAPPMLLTKPCPDAQYDKEPSHDADSCATLGAGVHRIYLPAPFDAPPRVEM
jgi:hypothetical protein